MTDQKSCSALQIPVVVSLGGTQPMILVGINHYPASLVYLRLDDDPPISSREPGWIGAQASNLLQRLLDAQRIRVRYTVFAGRESVDAEVDPAGLAAALDWAARAANE